MLGRWWCLCNDKMWTHPASTSTLQMDPNAACIIESLGRDPVWSHYLIQRGVTQSQAQSSDLERRDLLADKPCSFEGHQQAFCESLLSTPLPLLICPFGYSANVIVVEKRCFIMTGQNLCCHSSVGQESSAYLLLGLVQPSDTSVPVSGGSHFLLTWPHCCGAEGATETYRPLDPVVMATKSAEQCSNS